MSMAPEVIASDVTMSATSAMLFGTALPEMTFSSTILAGTL